MRKKEKQERAQNLLLPKNDVVFQALFGTKGSENILGGLLSKILNDKVENVSLDANQNLVRNIPDEKLGILDLRAKIGNEIDVNIEVQLVDQHQLPERILYYWAKRYGEQLKSGEDYSKLKKTIAILFTDYDIPELKEFKDSHTEWYLREKRNISVMLFKNIEIHIVEMPKILKYRKETEEGLSNWVEFLLNPESEGVKMSTKKDKELKDAYDKLETISGDEELRRLAELRMKYILDQNAGLREERKIGENIRHRKRKGNWEKNRDNRNGKENA